MTAVHDYRVDLEVFEGPLDLLLHLVKKHELDILDIPVSYITERYLAYLDLMQHMNLEVAGEYLLMAATLAHIKSRELLPPDPTQLDERGATEGDEEGDPRQELIQRLLEYQKYKEAGAALGDRPVVGRNVWRRGAPQDGIAAGVDASGAEAPLVEVPVFRLVEALAEVLSRARVKVTHDVVVERVTLAERINQLADRLAEEQSFTFLSCFDFATREEHSAAELKLRVVTTLLAILEMARLGLVRVVQVDAASDILVAATSADVKSRARGAVGDDYR